MIIPRKDDENSEIEIKKRGWRLDKSINLPFLLALGLAGMTGFGYVMTQDRRQTKSETRIENLEKRNDETKVDFKADLLRIENKLDRLIEKNQAIILPI